ncbi:MAG: OmpA family protein [Gallionellaceae bacterium]
MKKTITLALSAVLSTMTSAQASEFNGGFVGGRLGSNHSDISGVAPAGGKNTTAYGLDAGYNWDKQGYLLGLDGFLDFNGKSNHAARPSINYGSDAYGLDMKLGIPSGRWMPYGRLGYSYTKGTVDASAISGSDLHGGMGIEYKYTSTWGVSAEWMRSAAKTNGSKLSNDNFTFGLRYYFGGPKEVPPPVLVHARKDVEPAQPKSWKIIKEQTPVTIEGANFNFDSSKLRPTAAAKLQPVVEFANKYPDAGLDVHGHTDDIGSAAYNQRLSEKRAETVKTFLIKQEIDASRISTKGMGETEHIADNKSKQGRAMNRRVEIHYTVIDEKKVLVIP